MLRGEIPPQVFNHRRALFFRPCARRALLSPCTPLAVHFPYRALLSRGICSATLFGVVSHFVPRSIAIGETFCVDACAKVLD